MQDQGFTVTRIDLRQYVERTDDKLGEYSLLTAVVETDRGTVELKYDEGFKGSDALDSAPKSGDKKTYQMDPANAREALREAELDEVEGADILMVKPAGPYLDILAALRRSTSLPLAAYQVSGEYAMLKAACERGWLDEKRVVLESLLGIRRAGADVILTYFARQAAEWLVAASRR